jgi:hypothetical protein
MKTRFFLGAGHGPDYAGIAPVEVFALHTRQLDTGGETDRFGAPIRLTVDTSGLDLSDLDLASLRIARLGLDGSWDVLPTHASTDALSADSDQIGTFGVVARSAAATIDLTVTSDAPAAGRHRVDPGATVTITVRAVPRGAVATGTLHATVPLDWTLTDGDGATVDAATGELTWQLSSLDPGQAVTHPIVLQAPGIAAGAATLQTTGTFGAWIVRRRSPVTRADTASVLVAPRLMIGHRVMGRVDRSSGGATYGLPDRNLDSVDRFEILRVRFRIENPDSVPVTIAPLLQYLDPGPAQATLAAMPGLPGLPGITDLTLIPPPVSKPTWVALPGADDARGEAKFYVATESRDYAVKVDGIDESGTRTHDDSAAPTGSTGFLAAAARTRGRFGRGIHSMGQNPVAPVTVPEDGWTEVEFSVRATAWADWSTAYEMRLTDMSAPIEPSVHPAAALRSDPRPDHGPAAPGQGGRYVAPAYALVSAAGSVTANGSTASSMLKAAAGVSAAASTWQHGDISMQTDTCATCHRTHTATASYLRTGPDTQGQATQCFLCHNYAMMGSASAVQEEFAGATPNVPATGSYFQHPATVEDSGHTNANLQEFDRLTNPLVVRHAQCTDCHNPHSPTLSAAVKGSETAAGWKASGALQNGSGVAPVNGGPAATPSAYGWLNTPPQGDNATDFPVPTGALDLEYQLCFKCHSGYTKLLPQDPAHPSRWAIDKALELNPVNLSFHPIEGPGKNTTSAMSVSLSEAGPYRLWTLGVGDTVRCSQCHASSALLPAATPRPSIPADASLDSHASANRGILLANYRDRLLNVVGQQYAMNDFALCYLCHASQPFDDTYGNTRSDTDFSLHGRHIAGLYTAGTCTDTDIDHTVGQGSGCLTFNGAGSGNAICSECHFRTHSTVAKSPGQTGTDGSLINFAPNVRPYAGQLNWTRSAAGYGSCTLTCHGYVHNSLAYPD